MRSFLHKDMKLERQHRRMSIQGKAYAKERIVRQWICTLNAYNVAYPHKAWRLLYSALLDRDIQLERLNRCVSMQGKAYEKERRA